MSLPVKGVLLVVLAALGLAGVAWGTIVDGNTRHDRDSTNMSHGDGPPLRYSRSTLPLRASSVPEEPKAILDDILDQYGGHAIVDAKLGRPPPDWTGTEDSDAPVPAHLRKDRWLYVTVAVAGLGPESARPIWEAHLVAGALRDRLHLAGIEGDLIGLRVSAKLPDGTAVENMAGGIGDAEFAQSYSDDSAALIDARIRAKAVATGIQLESISILTPLQAAPAIIVTTDRIRRFAESPDIVSKLLGGRTSYEGAYVEVRDPAGGPLLIQATALRAAGAIRWVRPDLGTRGRLAPAR